MTGHPRYVNREWSWLQFNGRVLAEAANPENPLLERLKFLAIFESNLDEFYMVRVSGLIEQEAAGMSQLSPDGLSASQQLQMIAEVVKPLRAQAAQVWRDLSDSLDEAGIRIMGFSELDEPVREQLTLSFEREIFALLTPLMMEPAMTFPFISNRSLNLAVELGDGAETQWARVKVPPLLPRLVPIPGDPQSFILLEDLIVAHLSYLFPGVEVRGAHMFRVVRDADIEIRELEAADLIDAVEKTLRMRRFGDPVLLEVDQGLPRAGLRLLMEQLELQEDDTVEVDGRIGFDFLWEIAHLDRPELKFEPHLPYRAEAVCNAEQLFGQIRQRDVLIHLPYDDFEPVHAFVRSAANDPRVIGIKQTLYRVGAESPVVESLLAAAEAGKQVAVMVELKARFDENNNLVWSRALERSGVHVTYGTVEMKVHCKLCLIVRKDEDGIRSYAHIGTGNYNPSTAKLYTDLGLFTSDPEICQDITELFNYLTGKSRQVKYRKLLVAPLDLREQIIDRIGREIEAFRRTGQGRIAFKLNSLVDTEVIDALYEASQAGIPVDLVVRGICCLRPGVPGLSENIRVVSVVGRFLEHSRIYYFENGGEEEAFIGSADMMRRNLDRRIEVLAPVSDPAQIAYLRDKAIGLALEDNVKAWQMMPEGHTVRMAKMRGKSRNSQNELLALAATKVLPPV
ncbi:MAG: polyphosphate kinase 1 [Armatimonadetes bacterium]|nr:polyphosphate kinase 1 [Armatimonadota bacterium]MBX3110039.1 polyphosphate kinase 1 [Fimbriimonadaceae bacterium]